MFYHDHRKNECHVSAYLVLLALLLRCGLSSVAILEQFAIDRLGFTLLSSCVWIIYSIQNDGFPFKIPLSYVMRSYGDNLLLQDTLV